MAAQGPGADEKHRSGGGRGSIWCSTALPVQNPSVTHLHFSYCCHLRARQRTLVVIEGLEAPTPAIDKMVFLAVGDGLAFPQEADSQPWGHPPAPFSHKHPEHVHHV